jgi:Lar family restriction alleviation protein
MSEQLKGCPFCGGEAQTDFIEGESYIIECYACDARTGAQDSADDAIAAWNRRAPASEPAVDRTLLKPMQSEEDEELGIVRQWYFDCNGHYIDVALDDGKYSIFFKDRARKGEAWLDQADDVTPAAPAVPAAPLVAKNFEDRMNEAALKPFPFAWRPDLAPQGAQASPVLDDADIETVWLTMPGGPNGWLRSFGYLDFAQAIEELVLERLSERATGTDTSQGDA